MPDPYANGAEDYADFLKSFKKCVAGFPISDGNCAECGANWNERCGRYDYDTHKIKRNAVTTGQRETK